MANAALFAGLLTLVLCSQVFAQSEPVVSPTPTPMPPENIKVYNLTLNDTEDPSKVCLRLLVAIDVNVTYLVNNDNRSVAIPLTDMANYSAEDTFCHINSTTAKVVLIPDLEPDESLPFKLVFEFSGSNKTTDQHWNWGDIVLTIEHTDFLPGYDDDDLNLPLDYNTTSRLDDDTNSRLEFERSYKCNTTQTLSFNNTNKIHPFVYVSQLHVQAFHFNNGTGFDDARTCLLDTAGTANKIVPIAVGAALAGLVVVVLIAYLIGRLRSRRQSSYEALS